jgi:hypothetical protein
MPYVSLHGRAFGFDSESGKLQRPGASHLYDDEEGLTEASSVSNIKWRGTTTIGSTGATGYTLNAPKSIDLGIRKRIFATANSTAVRTVTLASGNFQSTAGVTANILSFNGQGQSIELVALSTALVGVFMNHGVTVSS